LSALLESLTVSITATPPKESTAHTFSKELNLSFRIKKLSTAVTKGIRLLKIETSTSGSERIAIIVDVKLMNPNITLPKSGLISYLPIEVHIKNFKFTLVIIAIMTKCMTLRKNRK